MKTPFKERCELFQGTRRKIHLMSMVLDLGV